VAPRVAHIAGWRFSQAYLSTWLLCATAAWAVLALLLAVFGMGGGVTLLPEDRTLLKSLPSLPNVAPERLGAPGRYGETTSRPLFADDRRPHPFSLRPEATEERAKAFDYILTSVLITPSFKAAIIRSPAGSSAPLRIKLGNAPESLPSWRLQSLSARSAVFAGPEGERRLDLRVYNGVGGEAATALTAPAARHDFSTAPAASQDFSVKSPSTQTFDVSSSPAWISQSSSGQAPPSQLNE
jgi:general secretion pathway protein N